MKCKRHGHHLLNTHNLEISRPLYVDLYLEEQPVSSPVNICQFQKFPVGRGAAVADDYREETVTIGADRMDFPVKYLAVGGPADK